MGRLIPDLGSMAIHGIRLPIAIGLLAMMYPVLATCAAGPPSNRSLTTIDALRTFNASKKIDGLGGVSPVTTRIPPLLSGDLAVCCSPLASGELDEEAAERLARVFRALGDRHRVRLLSLIAAADGGEACICDLTGPVGLSQPTVSHHMKQLAEAGLVAREQRGKWAYYRVVPETMAGLGSVLAGPAA